MIEFFNSLTEPLWVRQLGFVFGGLLAGILIERVLVRWLRRVSAKTSWNWDDLMVEALRGMPIVWLTTFGAWAALTAGNYGARVESWGSKALTVIALGSVVLMAIRLAGNSLVKAAERSEGALPNTTLVPNLARILVGALGLFIILDNIGIEITPILTALGVGGLAVALALQDTLGNLFSGIQIIISRQVRPLDFVQLSSGEQGYVEDVNWRNTTIRAIPDANLVVVPNQLLASNLVKNYSLPEKSLWISIPVGVHYDSDLEHVEEVTLEVAKKVLKEVAGGLPDDPMVRFKEFADSSINFVARLPIREFQDQFLIQHEFVKRLHRRFDAEGIVIPFPIRTLYFAEGEEGAVRLEGRRGDRKHPPDAEEGEKKEGPA